MRKVDKRNEETKKILVDAFINLSNEKPMNKISINDITNYCNLNRNTFYYHFEDIHGLINWLINEEITSILDGIDTYDVRDLFENVFYCVEKNKRLFKSAYQAFGRDHLRDLLLPYFYETLKNIIEDRQQVKANDLEYEDFIIKFYCDGMLSAIINYIQPNNQLSKETIIEYLMRTSIQLSDHIKKDF